MREQKGITLIALVITIIVLLILAGVTIAMLTGQNSILNRSTEATYTNDISEGKDQVSIAWNAAYTTYLSKYYTNTLGTDTFEKILYAELDKVKGGTGANYTLTGYGSSATNHGAVLTLTSNSNKNKISTATVSVTNDANAVTKASLGAWTAIADAPTAP